MTLLYPSIDLLDGSVVRLRQGSYDEVTQYASDPTALARDYLSAGCTWLHVVDLDAARSGNEPNFATLCQIVEAVGGAMSVQVGGGVRDVHRACQLRDIGVSRVVVGSAAVRNPEIVDEMAIETSVCVGLDHRKGRLAADGWTTESNMTVAEALERFRAADAALITDISRDGMLEGPDVAGIADAVSTSDTAIIASGGVASLDDIDTLASIPGLHGIISGRALMEGRFSAADAMRILRGQQ